MPGVIRSRARTSRAVPAGVVSRWCQRGRHRPVSVGRCRLPYHRGLIDRCGSAGAKQRTRSEAARKPPERDRSHRHRAGRRPRSRPEALDAHFLAASFSRASSSRPVRPSLPAQRRRVLAILGGCSTEEREDSADCELFQRPERNPEALRCHPTPCRSRARCFLGNDWVGDAGPVRS
jgi:hypothetical protein